MHYLENVSVLNITLFGDIYLNVTNIEYSYAMIIR